MATRAFQYALEDIDLIRKAVNALRNAASNTTAYQQAIQDPQILETVLDGVQKVSPINASGDTLKNLEYCSHFCRPPLDRFLRSLRELEPDLYRAPVPIEPFVHSARAPVWATRLEREVASLQGSVGTGLRVIDLLLWVEAMQCDVAVNIALPGDLQRMMDSLRDRLYRPRKHPSGPGHYYSNIQNSDNSCNHFGDRYFFNSGPPAAISEGMSHMLGAEAT